MDTKTKQKIKDVLIAALIGSSITFITHILEFLVGLDKSGIESALGGSAGALIYLKKAFSHIV